MAEATGPTTIEDLRTQALAQAARGEPMTVAEVAAIFRISTAHFYYLEKKGSFEHLKLRPAFGPRRFSGVLLQRYLNGESTAAQHFARRGSSHGR